MNYLTMTLWEKWLRGAIHCVRFFRFFVGASFWNSVTVFRCTRFFFFVLMQTPHFFPFSFPQAWIFLSPTLLNLWMTLVAAPYNDKGMPDFLFASSYLTFSFDKLGFSAATIAVYPLLFNFFFFASRGWATAIGGGGAYFFFPSFYL